MDSASLGESIHEIGACYLGVSQLVEARPWFELAIVEKQKGDLDGRVDASSVEASRRALDMCSEEPTRPDWPKVVTDE